MKCSLDSIAVYDAWSLKSGKGIMRSREILQYCDTHSGKTNNIAKCFTIDMCCVLASPEIIGYRKKCKNVWASNTKISFISEITTSPNVKLLAIG